MLKLAYDYLAYGERRSAYMVLSKRHFVFKVNDVVNAPYSELLKSFRALHIPLKMWDESIISISLFDEIARSSILIKDTDTLEDILPRIKIQHIVRLGEIVGVSEARTRWGVDPFQPFAIRAIKPGTHPTQPILPEEATDLVATPRLPILEDHNLLWVVDKYFYFSKKEAGGYILPNANTFLSVFQEGISLSYLDLSEMDMGVPVRFDKNFSIDEGNLTINYPYGTWDGVLIFVAGKIILDIRDKPDVIFSTGKMRLPLTKLNIEITHLAEWVETTKMEDLTWEKILRHETSFIVPYRNDLHANYKGVTSQMRAPHYLSYRDHEFEGNFIIDANGEIVPYLTEKMPNTTNPNEYFIEAYFTRKVNELTTTDYESDRGVWKDCVSAINRVGTGVAYYPKTSVLREVNLGSFSNIKYKED